MMKRFALCPLLFAFCLISCVAPTHYNLGREALDKEDYEKALVELRLAVKENPANAIAVRDLGIALVETQNFKSAALILEKAVQRLPQDGLTCLYLGRAYEKTGRLDDAIKLYRAYAEVENFDERRQIEARLDQAIQAKLRLEARQALANERALDARQLPEKSIAVLNFRNLGGNAGFDPLAKGLADMVITDLSQVKALTVIERSRMQALMEEMGLGQTGLVDEQAAPRVGQLLGVKKVLQGSFLDLAGGRLRLDANLADAAARASLPIGETSGELARFFRLEKNLVFKVIDELGIQLTEAEEKAILTIPTENLLAFLAYGRGLEARDRGDFAGAQKEFQEAVKIDPNFDNAKTQLERSTTQKIGREQRAATRRLAVNSPLTVAQKRKITLLRAASNGNPAFGFANKNLVPTLSRSSLESSVKELRQPLLEGRSVFGAKGEIIIDLKLP
jgi:TolB-like protein/Flp pilus assembly protein TadD